MSHATRRRKSHLCVALVVAALSLAAKPKTIHEDPERGNADGALPALTTPLEAPPEGLDGGAIVERMRSASQLRHTSLRTYSEMRVYEVRNLHGKVAAAEHVKLEYAAPGNKSFAMESAQGSWIVRDLVFKRLIHTEAATTEGRDHRDSSISSRNYRFHLVGEQNVGPYHCYVVSATPRRKNKYLFVGRLWINTRDFGVVRIAGHPAKKLSFWIERADFVRRYHLVAGFWLPAQDTTLVKVRLYGKRVLIIHHDTRSVNGQVLSGEQGLPNGDAASVAEKLDGPFAHF